MQSRNFFAIVVPCVWLVKVILLSVESLKLVKKIGVFSL